MTELAGLERFYLAGASAIAWHVGHRRSEDLALFSQSRKAHLERLERALAKDKRVRIIQSSDVMLALEVGGVPVDLVDYPYGLLEAPCPGPHGFPIASLLDLGAMKLAAISKRGIRRDFWDLYEIVRAGFPLATCAAAYLKKFERSHSDLYHVERALTWFEDAENDPLWPAGLTPVRWARIKAFFRKETPRLLEEMP
jgi:hypothetical protein